MMLDFKINNANFYLIMLPLKLEPQQNAPISLNNELINWNKFSFF